MEPQKTAQPPNIEEQPEQHDQHHDDHRHDQHHQSTSHLFNPDERKLTPYSLYLMNNNWNSGVDEADPDLRWTWPDYLCGIAAGVFLFIGLGLTELVNMYFGKTAVAIYLVVFIIFFFTCVTQLFIRRKKW